MYNVCLRPVNLDVQLRTRERYCRIVRLLPCAELQVQFISSSLVSQSVFILLLVLIEMYFVFSEIHSSVSWGKCSPRKWRAIRSICLAFSGLWRSTRSCLSPASKFDGQWCSVHGEFKDLYYFRWRLTANDVQFMENSEISATFVEMAPKKIKSWSSQMTTASQSRQHVGIHSRPSSNCLKNNYCHTFTSCLVCLCGSAGITSCTLSNLQFKSWRPGFKPR